MLSKLFTLFLFSHSKSSNIQYKTDADFWSDNVSRTENDLGLKNGEIEIQYDKKGLIRQTWDLDLVLFDEDL